jgi:3-phosphoshikimate 1-carboxyvinyltransferase
MCTESGANSTRDVSGAMPTAPSPEGGHVNSVLGTCYSRFMPPPGAVTVHPTVRVRGRVRPPGDKSISHRYALLAALAHGETTIGGYSTGADCTSTLCCLRSLGVSIEERGRNADSSRDILIIGRGLRSLSVPSGVLEAGNSGTTIRLLAGILAAHPFRAVLDGDASLRTRPMQRIITPLERMGARLSAVDGHAPLTILGTTDLTPIAFEAEVPSAQVKSAVLLAGLHADGDTSVTEPLPTRDHTERALEAFGARIERTEREVTIRGGHAFIGRRLTVPGDISSAAFWLAAAAALPGSDIIIEHVGLNPTRTGVLGVLHRMGANVDMNIEADPANEPMGTIRVRHAQLRPTEIKPGEVPGVIDELPVLAALAAHGGELMVSGAQELRVKESDRISALAEGLRRLGGDIDEQPDGFHVRGRRRLTGGRADAKGDHRLAMAFTVAALGATGPTTIVDAGSAAVSYPEFFSVLDSLRT